MTTFSAPAEKIDSICPKDFRGLGQDVYRDLFFCRKFRLRCFKRLPRIGSRCPKRPIRINSRCPQRLARIRPRCSHRNHLCWRDRSRCSKRYRNIGPICSNFLMRAEMFQSLDPGGLMCSKTSASASKKH